MALQLQIFEYEKKEKVRTVDIGGEIWWVAADVCKALGLKNPSEAIRILDNDEKRTLRVSEGGPERTIINEPGLYTLVLRSNKPAAKKFKRWVTHEVIPQIRKTGKYGLDQSGLPIFVRRFNENWDRVEQGYFSIISELFVRVYGRLEQVGHVIPDYGPDGKEVRPDVSVGRTFPAWLEKNCPELCNEYKLYNHILPGGMEVEARQYSNEILPHFIEFIETEWIPNRSENYFKRRDAKALAYLPKLLGEQSPTKDG